VAKRDIIINLLTKSDKKGLDDLEKGLEGVGKKAEGTGGKFGGLASLLGKFGDNVSKDLTGKLGTAGQALDNAEVGLGDLSGKAGIAGAAIVGLGAVIGSGVGKLKELYDNTRNFNEVAGTSWEEGSRLIAVFDDLRVSSDEGAKAMGYLSKTVGETPQKLGEYGIEIARAKDGTVDMAGTLENAATAFQNTVDPAKRAALGNDLFGRSWQNMVPVLQKGGDELKNLVDGVDKSQVATQKGADQQDKLFEATDNLHDAMDGLQRSLAEDLVPTLITLAETGTQAVGVLGKLRDVAKGPLLGDEFSPENTEKMQEHRDNLKEVLGVWRDFFQLRDDNKGKSDAQAEEERNAASAAVELKDKMLPTIPAVKDLADALETSADELATQKVRAKEAGDEFKKFEQNTKDLIQAQEDMRLAQLGAIDTSLALTEANRACGDASLELTAKAKEVDEAVRTYGAGSTEAAVATEQHRRALDNARGAAESAAKAEVNHAVQMAETRGQTLTAAEQIDIYRDKLIRLQQGAADPALIGSLQMDIDFLAETARQAQSAADNLHGLVQAMNDASGIERQFTGRDSSGTAVIRRATGGPVWPGQSYLVGEHGPEMVNFNGTGPGYVQSNPEAARFSRQSFGDNFPTITRNADGTVQFGGDPNVYPSSVVSLGGTTPAPLPGLQFPTLRTPPSVGGSAGVAGSAGSGYITGFGPPGASAAGGGGTTVIINNYGGFLDVKKLVDTIRAYEKAHK
jgi:hypothetical protein